METIKTISEQLQLKFEKIQAKFKTISTHHLNELQTEITSWKQNGLISNEFFKQNYSQFVFHLPKKLPTAHSIIIIGIPQKITRIDFIHEAKQYHTIIPPTYIFSEVRTTCMDILSNILSTEGYSVERAILPMKLLAVRSGLGRYGKNNLCYINRMGSCIRLEAFYTDYPFPTDDWQEKKLMDACRSCSLCRNACPTQCIPKDRILIHADHCLTYFNENLGKFPALIPQGSHHALVGCIQCQIVCPQNKKYLEYTDHPIILTEEETTCILHQTPQEDLPRTLLKKLQDLDMYEYYAELPRNLMVLINKTNNEK